MIISFAHRFIFIHGPKTAGTAMAKALASICGPDDIVALQRRNGFSKHDDSAKIYHHVGAATWKKFFKFTFERNPWDKVVSLYCMQIDPDHWRRTDVSRGTQISNQLRRLRYRRQPPSFRRWLLGKTKSRFHTKLPEYAGKLYHVEGDLAIDFVGRFENIEGDFRMITDRLNLQVELGGATRELRRRDDPQFDAQKPSYRKYYTPELREIVAETYTKEIRLFGYRF